MLSRYEGYLAPWRSCCPSCSIQLPLMASCMGVNTQDIRKTVMPAVLCLLCSCMTSLNTSQPTRAWKPCWISFSCQRGWAVLQDSSESTLEIWVVCRTYSGPVHKSCTFAWKHGKHLLCFNAWNTLFLTYFIVAGIGCMSD